MYQAGLLEEAFKISQEISGPQLREKVLHLQSAIRYAQEDYTNAQAIVLQRQQGHENTLNDEACLLYQVIIFSS